MGAATIALLAGQDVSVAGYAATNAVENNYKRHAMGSGGVKEGKEEEEPEETLEQELRKAQEALQILSSKASLQAEVENLTEAEASTRGRVYVQLASLYTDIAQRTEKLPPSLQEPLRQSLRVIQETLHHLGHIAYIQTYAQAALYGATVGGVWGSAVPGAGNIAGALGGAALSMAALYAGEYALTGSVQQAFTWLKDDARQQARTPQEATQFIHAVELTTQGFLGTAGLLMGGRILQGMPTSVRNLANSQAYLRVQSIEALGLWRTEVKSNSGLLNTPFSKQSRNYVQDMEIRSGIRISQEQRTLLKETLQQRKFEKLNISDKIQHGKQYNKIKDKLITEWESRNGRKWPTYPSNLKLPNGLSHPKAGKKHDLHHIIPQELGGPHEWWNMHPLEFGRHHQGGVHGKDSYLNQIIKDIKS